MTLRFSIKLAASITLFALVLWFIGPARVLASFVQADPRWLIAGFMASVTASLISALRWHTLAQWLGVHAPRLEMILAYWRGITANAVLPGATLGGDALRALHLQRYGHRIAHAAASVLLDRLSGLWMLVTLSLATAAVAHLFGLMPTAILGISSVLTGSLAILVLASPLLLWSLSTATTRHLPARAAALIETLHARPHPMRQYIAQMFWSGGVQIFSIAAFAFGCHAVGVELAWWKFVIAAGPIFVLATMPIGGGWGTREAASAIVLGAFGVPGEAAVAGAILYGLYATLQGLLGALSLLYMKGKAHD